MYVQSGVALDGDEQLLFDYNQRFMDIVDRLQPQRILVIGGGACTFPLALTDCYPDMQIDVGERDPLLLAIAEQYFQFKQTKGVRAYIDDGRHYLDTTTQRYDFICVDAFSGGTVPVAFQGPDAMGAVKAVLDPAGVMAINIIGSYYGRRAQPLLMQLAAMQSTFTHVTLFTGRLSLHSK